MRYFCCVVGLVLLSMGWQEDAKPDLSTPIKTIEAFVAALNRNHVLQAAACVEGAKPSPALEELHRFNQLPFRSVEEMVFSCTNFRVETEADSATVTVSVSMSEGAQGQNVLTLPARDERVRLHREGTAWKIVPPDLEAIKALYTPPNEAPSVDLLTTLSSLYAYPDIFLASRLRASQVKCTAHMKQLWLFAMMYTEEHKERFTFSPATYKQSLMPYFAKFQRESATRMKKIAPILEAEIKREIVFHCPLDPGEEVSYAFNANLKNLPVDDIKNPAQTVLFYEGKNGKLAYRHAGKAAVGFADAHVEMVNAQGAKKLLWLPFPGFKPKPEGK